MEEAPWLLSRFPKQRETASGVAAALDDFFDFIAGASSMLLEVGEVHPVPLDPGDLHCCRMRLRPDRSQVDYADHASCSRGSRPCSPATPEHRQLPAPDALLHVHNPRRRGLCALGQGLGSEVCPTSTAAAIGNAP